MNDDAGPDLSPLRIAMEDLLSREGMPLEQARHVWPRSRQC